MTRGCRNGNALVSREVVRPSGAGQCGSLEEHVPAQELRWNIRVVRLEVIVAEVRRLRAGEEPLRILDPIGLRQLALVQPELAHRGESGVPGARAGWWRFAHGQHDPVRPSGTPPPRSLSTSIQTCSTVTWMPSHWPSITPSSNQLLPKRCHWTDLRKKEKNELASDQRFCVVPPGRFELPPLPPEGSALSPELWGPKCRSTLPVSRAPKRKLQV
jgi:hypothetical protein